MEDQDQSPMEEGKWKPLSFLSQGGCSVVEYESLPQSPICRFKDAHRRGEWGEKGGASCTPSKDFEKL